MTTNTSTTDELWEKEVIAILERFAGKVIISNKKWNDAIQEMLQLIRNTHIERTANQEMRKYRD